MIAGSGVVWIATSALLAVCLVVLYAWQRRQERALAEFSQQVWQLTRGAAASGRVRLEGKPEAIGQLGGAVNQLLENLERSGARMHDREQLFQRLVEAVHDAVLITRDRIMFANQRFLALLGLPREAVVGKPLSNFVAADYVGLVDQNLSRRLAGEPAAERYEVELIGAQGQVTRVELSSAVIDSAGESALLLTALEMLPAASPAAAASARPRAMATLDAMGEGVITVDTDGHIDYVNHAATQLLGQRFDQVVGKSFPDVASLVEEADRRSLGDPVGKALTSGSRISVGKRAVLVPAAGAPERSVEISVSPLRFDGAAIAGVVIVLHDTSELRGLTRQMSYQASHDALTGLVNRREFERRLQEAMDSARAGDVSHALAYLDLDRFKVVNDTCGHTAGDNMLREVASLIKDAVRDSDTVGRIGGDEFALLLVGCPLEKARQIADDVVRSVNDYRFVWKDKIFNIGVSVGLVEIGRDGATIEDIINSADSACYIAKKQGGVHVHVYSAREEASARHRGEIHWLQKLQAALRDNAFELYFQPIVHAQRGGEHGPALEVFVRLKAENGQPGTPTSEFIRAAERYRLMPHIDRWVVQAVLSALGRGGLKLPEGRSHRDQHRGPDSRRLRVPRIRRRLLRSHGRLARRNLLRSHGEFGRRQHGPRAPVHRGAARHGMRIRARRLRQRLELVLQLEDLADGLFEDRRLVHPQPRRGQRQPGRGRRDDRAFAQLEFPCGRGAGRGPAFPGRGEAHGHRLRPGLHRRPPAAPVDRAGAAVAPAPAPAYNRRAGAYNNFLWCGGRR